jgi:hypothetical protein
MPIAVEDDWLLQLSVYATTPNPIETMARIQQRLPSTDADHAQV